jgi:hypothetical protein
VSEVELRIAEREGVEHKGSIVVGAN